MIAVSPGAPQGEVLEVHPRGRISILTESGRVNILIQRLRWSPKAREWRCYSMAVYLLMKEHLAGPSGAQPLLGSYVRLDGWPLATCGLVAQQITVGDVRAFVISTERGPVTFLADVMTYCTEDREWVAMVHSADSRLMARMRAKHRMP